MLGTLEVEGAGDALRLRRRRPRFHAIELRHVEVGQLYLEHGSAQIRVGELEQDVCGLDVAVHGIADQVTVFDGSGDRDYVVQNVK